MLLPEDKGNKNKDYQKCPFSIYTPIMEVLETLKCTTCCPKSNLTFNREFELLLKDRMEKFSMNLPDCYKH